MSIINKMLQELDRRHARAAPPGQSLHPEVRAVRGVRGSGEWFWRVVAGLMLVAAAWTLWVVYQLQPRSIATELAERAADDSRRRVVAAPAQPTSVAEATLVAAPVGGRPAIPAETVTAKPAPEKLAAPIEILRLALAIDTPLAPRPARQPAPAKAEVRSNDAAAPRARPEAVRIAQPRIEKRERDRTPTERAEEHFRRAAQMLEQGRVANAMDALRAALDADHAHQAARQTLVALYIEQRRIDDARRHLQEGLAFNPGYAPFAVALARIHVDRGEFPVALAVLEKAAAAGHGNADFHALHGAVLQRLGRHAPAADAYRLALGAGPQSGAAWVGLAISLEAQGNLPEAAEAFRRGVASGSLTDDVRAYADQRVRQLQ
ncbi:MAG: tetratricopeptide repeat protein [Betaproteobacteria bacterium]|nr:tetratricopeptide repeat protein [Betaproteobacteria bacterium]